MLFEPQIPQNTGNIARTCACTGARLHLVGPMGFSIDDKKLKRAGLDYWHYLDITYYENTQEFLEKHSDDSLFFFTTKGRKVYSEQSYPDNCYLIFGREDAGIDEHILLRHPDSCLRLPMIGPVRSLNRPTPLPSLCTRRCVNGDSLRCKMKGSCISFAGMTRFRLIKRRNYDRTEDFFHHRFCL